MDYETLERWKNDYEGESARMKAEEERRRNSDDPKERESQAFLDKLDADLEAMKKEFSDMTLQFEKEMEAKEHSADPEERLQWFWWNKQRTCKHEGVPLVKSYYSDEMVQRGRCEECMTHLLELD